MTDDRARRLSRRAIVALPAVLGGCSLFDSWLGDNKDPLPGNRVAVMNPRRGMEVDAKGERVVVPPAVANADWPQAGGVPSHAMGHLQVGDVLQRAWRSDIGDGSGYRRKLTAQAVVSGGRVFTMDSDAVVSAFDAAGGGRIWRLDTQADDDRSSNIGGGISLDGDTVYAGTGRAEMLAVEAATGTIRWRKPVGIPLRAAPTIAGGRIFTLTLDNQLLALSVEDGRRLWAYQAAAPETAVLGLASPAFADGLVVAGFGSGDLVALRATSGSVAWSDSLASARGRNSMADLSAVRGLPVIADGRVYAGSLGGLTLSLDLRTGRRLWERDIATGNTPWVAGDWMFVLSTDNQLAAILRADGRIAWVAQLPEWEDEEKKKDPIRWIGPVLAGGRLILGSSTAQALAVSPYTGEILGQQSLSDGLAVAPSIAGGTMLLITDNGTVTALR